MYEKELASALEAAARAGTYLMEAYARFEVIPDAPADITTDADRQAQDIIMRYLRSAHPEDAVCAEEATAISAGIEATGARLWIVDPIDGTRGFARKNGEFSVMIAFAERGQLGAGVVFQPAAARLTYASVGAGCWRRDGGAEAVRCRVTDVAELTQSTLTQSRSRTPGKKSRWVESLQPARVVESYSAGIKLALVARGEADVYLNTYDAFHDWDIAAGHVLVSEAGGRVSGTGGEELAYGLPGAWQKHGLLATNARLHDAALERIRAAR
jgi:3'(2'), 5'-bisphosphate nucleotidase